MFTQDASLSVPDNLRSYSMRDARKILGVGENKLYWFVNRGLLKTYMFGGVRRVNHGALAQFLKDLESGKIQTPRKTNEYDNSGEVS